jgi:hypothetical protein
MAYDAVNSAANVSSPANYVGNARPRPCPRPPRVGAGVASGREHRLLSPVAGPADRWASSYRADAMHIPLRHYRRSAVAGTAFLAIFPETGQ